MGRVTVAFVDDNNLGVLDHVVTLPDGQEVLNPLRVFANNDGSEVVFTLFHLPGVDGAAFERDAALVGKDLATLKALLEASVS
ncbi:MAG: polyketide cyclase [Nocardioidaceae bacterium]|nr:polyketide cyclase [Nocardioidaceae bacterium]